MGGLEELAAFDGGLLLSTRLVYEELIKLGYEASFCCGGDGSLLDGVFFLDGHCGREGTNLYIQPPDSDADIKDLPDDAAMVVFSDGECPKTDCTCGMIAVRRDTDPFALFNDIQKIFEYYRSLERELWHIAAVGGGIDDVCLVAVRHFGCPVFVHDEYFHILACTEGIDYNSEFTFNEVTGKYLQSAETINHFRTSRAYGETLSTTGGQLWESDFDEGVCFYANLWTGGSYHGRLIVRADKDAGRGQLCVITYFAKILEIIMSGSDMSDTEAHNPFGKVVVKALGGGTPDKTEITKGLEFLGWDEDDLYCCGVATLAESDINSLSLYCLCTDFERRIKDSHACCFQGGLYLIVNLTKSGLDIRDLRMKLSYCIREGLLHMGVSLPFNGFSGFNVYFRQAGLALKYSRESDSTSWYVEFRDYVLYYWLGSAGNDLPVSSLIPGALHLLSEYDAAHGTDLYRTLKTFLNTERNSTLTAQLLGINRSTLPHRLERIHGITGMDLNDASVRLYLLMGFYIEDYPG